ncbi:MAG: N-formylglutamate amidohydrolase [Methanoregulaceae archaeon]|nr:N-formylglutamate amidohydrolase [Methanoregulaceae archaeon]
MENPGEVPAGGDTAHSSPPAGNFNAHAHVLSWGTKVNSRYPFLISVPHGGTSVPPELCDRIALSGSEVSFYSDPATRVMYEFRDSVSAYLDTPVTRMAVDLNRNPLDLPPRKPDGVVKSRTAFGTPVYLEGSFPEMPLVHHMLMTHFFPYHEALDRLLDNGDVSLALDCHSMLPVGPPDQKDAGARRPLVCLGNNGDRAGKSRRGGLATCPSEWICGLAGAFRTEFPGRGEVAINVPYSGGFIVNAHYWHRGIPWIQVEMNRSLYEPPGSRPDSFLAPDQERLVSLRERVWRVLADFWDSMPG